MKKKIIYVDMDGVLADFGAAIAEHPMINISPYDKEPDLIPDIFEDLPPLVGAIESIKILTSTPVFEVFILTTAPWKNPSSWTHKRLWVEKYLGDLLTKKVIISHRKDLLKGDFLIDDRIANSAGEFEGFHIHFGWDYMNNKWNTFPDWKAVMDYLLAIKVEAYYSIEELKIKYNKYLKAYEIESQEGSKYLDELHGLANISFEEFVERANSNDEFRWQHIY
jgi:5'(3')-deoxyribonucleotidase